MEVEYKCIHGLFVYLSVCVCVCKLRQMWAYIPTLQVLSDCGQHSKNGRSSISIFGYVRYLAYIPKYNIYLGGMSENIKNNMHGVWYLVVFAILHTKCPTMPVVHECVCLTHILV